MGAWLESLSLPALLGVVALAFVGLALASSALGFLGERLLRRRRIWDVALEPGQYRFELVGNLKYLAVHIPMATAFLGFGWLRFGDGSGLATFAGMYLGFQLYYYFLHRALHHRALVRFHRWHHRSRVTTPLTGLSMGFVEALGYAVGFYVLPAALSQLGAAPWLAFDGWLAYMVFNNFGNIVGHGNFELGSPITRSRVVAIFQPPFVFHALHHARWVGHFGFASAGYDALFGTEFADWRELHRRVYAGSPLPYLKFRGGAASRDA
ncbi:MAG: sterol desaturase family protein [Myxococcales bacterium]|nr:sterol desaturase family protein [Myxococcales bacterium]